MGKIILQSSLKLPSYRTKKYTATKFKSRRTLPQDLAEAIEDSRLNRNLHGPFETAEDAVKSMLED